MMALLFEDEKLNYFFKTQSRQIELFDEQEARKDSAITSRIMNKIDFLSERFDEPTDNTLASCSKLLSQLQSTFNG